MRHIGLILATIACLITSALHLAAAELKTNNFIFIMLDGLRWQEVFTGAEELLLNKENGGVRVTNGMNFSYPGYNELLCGFPDRRINSNAKRPNPNVTMLEWLNGKPVFEGKVAGCAQIKVGQNGAVCGVRFQWWGTESFWHTARRKLF